MKNRERLPVGRKVRILEDTVHHGLETGKVYKINGHNSWGSYLIKDEDGDKRSVPVDNTEPIPKRSFWTVLKNIIERTPMAI